MNILKFIGSLIKNWFNTGLTLAILLTLLEFISPYKHIIGFYAFICGSFILINLFQYYTIYSANYSATKNFLIHSIIGGIVWVIYATIMYVAHMNNLGKMGVISLTFNIFIIVSIIYYYYCINNKLNF